MYRRLGSLFPYLGREGRGVFKTVLIVFFFLVVTALGVPSLGAALRGLV